MERRQFLITLAAGGLTLVAAGKKAFANVEEVDTFIPENIRARDIQITILRNHGHELHIRNSDLRNYRNHDYNIRGRATHNHYLYLSRNDFMSLARGREVRVMSSTDYGHSHGVILSMRHQMYQETLSQQEARI